LTERELFQWICYPGFSTASEITETSGRGVGMDVVKAAVESLGGMLEIYSKRGEGTRFLMKLPLSIAIIKILLVECDGRTMGIPVTRVL
ncbi:MAG: chemotaxis protein CheA, partial [Desulfuromonadales bacterium]|nr:chemotaxis protein CheA [Desulfuromonadales bacterium]NIS42540.1 chemotaxis protein CheA [Desulfuromonadales bacterium]